MGYAEIVKYLLLRNKEDLANKTKNQNNENENKDGDDNKDNEGKDNKNIKNNGKNNENNEKKDTNNENDKNDKNGKNAPKKKKGSRIRNILNIVDNESNTALHYACDKGHTHLIHPLLFNHNLHGLLCEINLQNMNGQTPLHVACEKGHLSCVKDILSYATVKCDINLKDKKGHTALERAVCKHNHEIVKELLDAGADVNVRANNLMTCIMVAAQTKDNKMVEMLLDNKKCAPILYYENKWDRNVLYYLSKYKCDEKVYARVLNELKSMLHECLIVYYPDLIDNIAQLLADMTYGVKLGDTLKDEAATQMYTAVGVADRKPGEKLPYQ